jgi:DNA-binding XRE family transcriptional regulator
MKISLKALRVNADLSQSDAAKAIGITKRTLQKWETSTTFPDARQILKICEVYGCTMSDIFFAEKAR